MPHLDNKPQHFFKSAQDKSVHRHSKLVDKKGKVADKKQEIAYKMGRHDGGHMTYISGKKQ